MPVLSVVMMRLIVQTRCGKCSIIRCTGDFWLDSSRWSLKLFQAGSNISAVYNSSALLFCNLSSKGNALLSFWHLSFHHSMKLTFYLSVITSFIFIRYILLNCNCIIGSLYQLWLFIGNCTIYTFRLCLVCTVKTQTVNEFQEFAAKNLKVKVP